MANWLHVACTRDYTRPQTEAAGESRSVVEMQPAGKDRKKVPVATQQDVLMEAGYKCANPTCRHILTLDLHHIIWVKDGGGNAAANLLALCPNCHSLHTNDHIPQGAIRHWKGMLGALNHAFDRRSMDLLLFLYEGEMNGLTSDYSGDGVLAFAAIIAAGLAHAGRDVSVIIGGEGRSGASIAFWVRLTEKGRLMVEYWKAGDEVGYRALLTHGPPPD